MKNNKGFTLIEIMVALTIIMIIIFAFTPITVYSFKKFHESGTGQKELYAQKSTIEDKLATRKENTDLPSVTINTVFKETVSAGGQTVSKTGPISVTGFFVSDTNNLSDFKLATVYTALHSQDNKARIRLIPNVVSEDDDISEKTIYIYSEFFIFSEDDISYFELYDKNGSRINEVNFKYVNNTTVSMKFNSTNNNPPITASLQPYTVRLGDNNSITAKLYVEPPNIIVATAYGQYFSSKGIDITGGSGSNTIPDFYQVNETIGGHVNDLIWDNSNSRYIAVGDDGNYRTLSGGNHWVSDSITGNGSIVNVNIILAGYRNKTPSIKTVGLDHRGIPVIGGIFPYQVRLHIGWRDDGTTGFVTDYFEDESNLNRKFPKLLPDNILSYSDISHINGITTSIKGNSVYTLAAGMKDDRAKILARNPSIDNDNWFDIMSSYSPVYSEPTGITSGIIYSGTEEIPVYVFCTLDGKVYSATNIQKNNTHWQEENIGSGVPGEFRAITFANNKFVAVGNSRRVLVGTVQTNGTISWTFNNNGIASGVEFNDIAFINDRFYAVGQRHGQGIIYVSLDAEHWSEANLIFEDNPEPFIAIAGRHQQ
ncbi:MAG: prepilin-type N-terminal cleavage/methylation domain-containing protein [Clostridiaceae bacterium]|nr:prepilin-type N-terminal cleavage/methylation domain-containing protein [Clostridiaceae bacterium]